MAEAKEPLPFDSIPTTDVSSFCKINERGIGSLDLYVFEMGLESGGGELRVGRVYVCACVRVVVCLTVLLC